MKRKLIVPFAILLMVVAFVSESVGQTIPQSFPGFILESDLEKGTPPPYPFNPNPECDTVQNVDGSVTVLDRTISTSRVFRMISKAASNTMLEQESIFPPGGEDTGTNYVETPDPYAWIGIYIQGVPCPGGADSHTHPISTIPINCTVRHPGSSGPPRQKTDWLRRDFKVEIGDIVSVLYGTNCAYHSNWASFIVTEKGTNYSGCYTQQWAAGIPGKGINRASWLITASRYHPTGAFGNINPQTNGGGACDLGETRLCLTNCPVEVPPTPDYTNGYLLTNEICLCLKPPVECPLPGFEPMPIPGIHELSTNFANPCTYDRRDFVDTSPYSSMTGGPFNPGFPAGPFAPIAPRTAPMENHPVGPYIVGPYILHRGGEGPELQTETNRYFPIFIRAIPFTPSTVYVSTNLVNWQIPDRILTGDSNPMFYSYTDQAWYWADPIVITNGKIMVDNEGRGLFWIKHPPNTPPMFIRYGYLEESP